MAEAPIVTQSEIAADTANDGTHPAADPDIETKPVEGGEAIESAPGTDTPAATDEARWQPTGTWTTRRLIVLCPGGPVPIELSVSVGSTSLDESSEDALEAVADELLNDTPLAWTALLEQPLVKSGWLGNLVADEEQQDQLIAMYDLSKDGMVDRDELPPFLSRGLSRSDALQLSDTGNAPDVDIDSSPWGVADSNNDYSLDAAELIDLPAAIMRLDINGDSTVTSQELAESRGMQAMDRTMGRSMLEVTSLVVVDMDSEQSRRKQASKILRHYTFLESMPRDQWPNWSDAFWGELDSNGDLRMDVYEVERLLEVACRAQLYLRLDGSIAQTSVQEYAGIIAAEENATWVPSSNGGQLSLPGCSVLIQVTDAFDPAGRKGLRNRLEIALSNAQLKAFFTNQLQLSEGAFELADVDGNSKLDDEEYARVWRWLTARQGSRMVARWMLSARPWFQLVDANGDGRLSEYETAAIAKQLISLDRNGDERITPNELPLVARMEIARTDSRLAAGPLDAGQNNADEVDADWFSAMDANRDGVLNRMEFLGSREEFNSADSDKDGFVSRVEVVSVP